MKEEKKATRAKTLLTAYEIVNGARCDAYGAPEDNFREIAYLWNWWHKQRLLRCKDLGTELKGYDVAVMMALLKVARLATGTATNDSFIDAEGYLALAFDMYEKDSLDRAFGRTQTQKGDEIGKSIES